MQSRIRKIGAFFFLGIFFFNAVLYYACMGVLDIHAKVEMAYAVKHNPKNIVELDIPVSQGKDLKEYAKDGKLYDVVRTIRQGNTVHIFAISDNKEGDIFNKVADYVSFENGIKSNPVSHHSAKGIFKTVGQDYLPLHQASQIYIAKFSKHIFYSPLILHADVSMKMVCQPPEFITA